MFRWNNIIVKKARQVCALSRCSTARVRSVIGPNLNSPLLSSAVVMVFLHAYTQNSTCTSICTSTGGRVFVGFTTVEVSFNESIYPAEPRRDQFHAFIRPGYVMIIGRCSTSTACLLQSVAKLGRALRSIWDTLPYAKKRDN